MARGIFTEGLGGMSGSVNKRFGGLTYSKRGVIRARVIPQNPRTSLQGLVRANFSTITKAWGSLTPTQQAGWDAAASSGEWPQQDTLAGVPRNPVSGKELFQNLNGNLAAATRNTEGLITDVPNKALQGGSTVTDVTATLDGSTFALDVNFAGSLATGGSETHVVELTSPLSSGTTKLRVDRLRFFTTDDGATPITLGPAYAALYGAQAIGNKIGYRIKATRTDTGQTRFVGEGIAVVVAA